MTEKKGRIATAATALGAVTTAISLVQTAKGKYEERILYTASLQSNAYIYDEVLEWLNEFVKGKKVKFNSRYHGVRRFYDGSGKTKVTIGGYPFNVEVTRPESVVDASDEMASTFNTDRLVFTTPHQKGLDALEKFLVELTEKSRQEQRNTYIFNMANYGWDGRDFIKRPLDSVFLPEGTKEDFLHDLDTFLSSEEQYLRMGVPYHRGYLFHGPPGNGKSSLALAIASQYNMNLYNMPLSSIKDDRDLSTKFNEIQPNSVLLIEDIDIFSKSMHRQQADTGPTLAGLLNALDGVSTPHGLLTVMTTNRIEVLDDALIRPGRVDKRLELLAPNDYQVESMFKHAYGQPLNVPPRKFDSVAELSNVFKGYALDPESARIEIKRG